MKPASAFEAFIEVTEEEQMQSRRSDVGANNNSNYQRSPAQEGM